MTPSTSLSSPPVQARCAERNDPRAAAHTRPVDEPVPESRETMVFGEEKSGE
jgi:hypothetical protein